MVTAESFWDAFSSELLAACLSNPTWQNCFSSASDWTRFTAEVFFSVGQKLGFDRDKEIQREFYKIDFIYYKVFDNPQENFVPQNKWEANWDLEVALEHENDHIHWLWNIAKLSHINCGLKVIIGYHHYDNEVRKGTIKQKLDYVKELYEPRKYKQNPDNWLLILGPYSYNQCVNGNDFVAYKFDGENFYLLDDKKILRNCL